jgi:hypothetical protein
MTIIEFVMEFVIVLDLAVFVGCLGALTVTMFVWNKWARKRTGTGRSSRLIGSIDEQ